MKFKHIAILSLIASVAYATELPVEFFDIKYQTMGSCSENNLSFNTARFTKIDLKTKRDDLDLYLQILLYINDDGLVRVRTTEMGLVACKMDPQSTGQICSFKPYPDTKKIFETRWDYVDQKLVIEHVGSISKIRDDFPWLGFELKISDDFPYEIARDSLVVGGKVQINVDQYDTNTARICKNQN
jgi:hypothetical protein